MKNKINKLMGVGIALTALVVVAVPSSSFAATYAFVNNSGDVAIVVADNPTAAIATAVDRMFHSGVILLKTAEDYNIVDK